MSVVTTIKKTRSKGATHKNNYPRAHDDVTDFNVLQAYRMEQVKFRIGYKHRFVTANLLVKFYVSKMIILYVIKSI